MTPIIKERLGGDDAPEELPFEAYAKYFKEEIHKLEEGEMMIFDGWNYQIPELQKLVEIVGNPKCLVSNILHLSYYIQILYVFMKYFCKIYEYNKINIFI